MLSPAGEMLYDVLREIPQHCPAYTLDEYIVMPDHVHFVVNVGYLNPGGMLAFLLADLANNTPITIISQKPTL